MENLSVEKINKTKFDIHEYVNDIIIEQLGKIKNGNCDYLINSKLSIPYNPITNIFYNSINFVVLSLIAEKKMHKYNAWATFQQIKTKGGKLKKGAKSEKVIFYSFLYLYKEKKISLKQYIEYEKKLSFKDCINDLKKTSYIKHYNVFNFRYIEGLDDLLREDEGINYKPINQIEEAQKIVNESRAIIHSEKVNTGYYDLTQDFIVMPESKFFKSSEKYYSTLFHELSHWTGHKSRLNRVFSNLSKEYAFEELIAEFSSAYLCTLCGIKSELNNSAYYIDSWLSALENDKKFAFKAISKSKKAFDFLSKPKGLL